MSRILLVEDYEPAAIILKHLCSLSMPECEITWVDNGLKAVEIIKKDPAYDGIIMNYMMPVMDGITATQEIRALGYTKPIIGFSGYPKATVGLDCLDAGMDHYIEKNASMEAILGVIQNIKTLKPQPKLRKNR